jgi:aquaporin Z
MLKMKKYWAELIGTFVLVLVGCGTAAIFTKFTGNLALSQVGIAFAFGLSVLAMVYAIGHISGCHINPAISIAMLVAGRLSWKDTIFYIIFQCVGAILAAAVLWLIVSGMPGYTVAANGLGQNGFDAFSPGKFSLLSCFVAEVVFTAIFLFVIFGSISKNAPSGFAGISIGLTLVLIHLACIPITGTSVNPARSLGPAVFAGGAALSQLWLFIVAPIIGAVLAAVIWRFGFKNQ